MRKVVTPTRHVRQHLVGRGHAPRRERRGPPLIRDIYDHLIRISDLVDGYRDLLSGVMDTHLSTVSNRLNVVMKQLTIIATVFLPLSFLTGFFGQNFAWLVGHITGWVPFAVFGLGLEAVSALLLLYLFRKRGWLGGPPPEGRGRAPPAAMTATVERNDSTDATEAHERMEPTPRKRSRSRPTTGPSRWTGSSPTEPMERIEPAELTDRIEPVELIDQRDRGPAPPRPGSLAHRTVVRHPCGQVVVTAACRPG